MGLAQTVREADLAPLKIVYGGVIITVNTLDTSILTLD